MSRNNENNGTFWLRVGKTAGFYFFFLVFCLWLVEKKMLRLCEWNGKLENRLEMKKRQKIKRDHNRLNKRKHDNRFCFFFLGGAISEFNRDTPLAICMNAAINEYF